VQPNTDWWVPFYPPGNMQRPTGPLCDGCHSVNYNAQAKTVTEWNVGCERCHGPGSEHARQPSVSNIVNPAKLDFVRRPIPAFSAIRKAAARVNRMFGQHYDWPVGFHQGGNLGLLEAEEHKLGETSFTHFPDVPRTRIDAGNDFVQMIPARCRLLQLPTYGRRTTPTCRSGPQHLPDCHARSPNDRTMSRRSRSNTHHRPVAGDRVECHMPKIAQTIASTQPHVCSSPPSMTDIQDSEPGTSCHKDRNTSWARGDQAWRDTVARGVTAVG
jgi:hypothetical protein